MIHIVNGDILASKLQGLSGKIMSWREMYDFGPFHSSWSNEELITRRAAFFDEKLEIPSSLFSAICHKQLAQLSEIPHDEEVVLWFEHDRYDQTMLMYILTQLANQHHLNISMVSVNSYPGISPFYGLSQLLGNQLLELFHSRKTVSSKQVNEAEAGWRVYTSSDSEEVKKWVADIDHELPFLLEVLTRHESYLPSAKTGLNIIESIALNAIATKPVSFRDLFHQIAPSLKDEGLSNLHLSALLNELVKGDQALLKTNGLLPMYGSEQHNPILTITSFGERVLSGEANRIDLIGIDWWIGGVHLQHLK
ncbi:DUF1835 domain-containing protein [uncultured Metabacillus sp.]|uniref:DUF1835 domain-containing protein n=1 Tax=uncultured Metabacillus sp. TaxID=2860135 RepID=UPI00260BDF1E|nr:DUF1835 domain-containing protein [uncultured Metabacillus sp.]